MKHYETKIDAEKHPVTRKIEEAIAAKAAQPVPEKRAPVFTRKEAAPLTKEQSGLLSTLTKGI